MEEIKWYYFKITNFIKENEITKKKLSDKKLNSLKKILYSELGSKSEKELDFTLINYLWNNFFEIKYKCNLKSLDEINLRMFDNKYQLYKTKIEIPEEFEDLYKHFLKLYNQPQPEQRSDDWFKYRYERITASDWATALNENPYEPPESLILKKCDPDFPFLDNTAVHHGKKYEPIATMIYEHIYNTKVTEFGCIMHKDIPFLGASPDGISSIFTMDNKFNKRLGRMLEIKCPLRREIIMNGKIDGVICPHYYWCQVQGQLECCDLEYCDFWQCNLKEYDSYYAWLNYDKKGFHGHETEIRDINSNFEKGCFIQLLPKKEIDNPSFEKIYQAKYIYPSHIDMDINQYQTWIIHQINYWEKENPHLKDYYFDRIIYWRLITSHNQEIKRDRKWFQEKFPILENFWKDIKITRNNPEKLKNIKDYLTNYKKKKYNTKIKNVNQINL